MLTFMVWESVSMCLGGKLILFLGFGGGFFVIFALL